MRESEVERAMKKKIEKLGGLFLKWVSPGFTGVPDRIALLPGGRLLFVEVKRPGGKRSPRQKRVHQQFEELGFPVVTADREEDLDGYL